MMKKLKNITFILSLPFLLAGCGNPTACDSSAAQDLVAKIAVENWGWAWRQNAKGMSQPFLDLYKKSEESQQSATDRSICDENAEAFDEALRLDVDDPRAYESLRYWSGVSRDEVEDFAKKTCASSAGEYGATYSCIHAARGQWKEEHMLAELKSKGEIGCQARMQNARKLANASAAKSIESLSKTLEEIKIKLSNIRPGAKIGNKNLCAANINVAFPKVSYELNGEVEYSLEKNTDGELYAEVLLKK